MQAVKYQKTLFGQLSWDWSVYCCSGLSIQPSRFRNIGKASNQLLLILMLVLIYRVHPDCGKHEQQRYNWMWLPSCPHNIQFTYCGICCLCHCWICFLYHYAVTFFIWLPNQDISGSNDYLEVGWICNSHTFYGIWLD